MDFASLSRRWILLFAGCAAVAAIGASAAPARATTTFVVNATVDAHDANGADGQCRTALNSCTIRAAVEQANALFGPDVVRVPAGDYSLTLGLVSVASAIDIVGPDGARATKIDAHGSDSRLGLTAGPVSISGLTITGKGSGPAAVYVQGPEVTISDVDIRGNTSTSGAGGGLWVFGGALRLSHSSITGNTLTVGDGAFGGGVAVSAGNVEIASTTIAGNSATATAIGSDAHGGGVATSGTALTLRHVTLLDNHASSGSAAQVGGNLYVQGDTLLADSIVAGGTAVAGPNCYASDPAKLAVAGRNVYAGGNGNCAFPAGTLVSAEPGLTALGDHGGTGSTAVPLPDGAAIDNAAGCPDDGADQRGAQAPTGAACDIGAAEASADLRVTLVASVTAVGPGAQVSYVAMVSNLGVDESPSTTLTLTPPAGTIASLVVPSKGSCAPPAVCSLGTLARGESATVTVSVTAPASGPMVARASAAGALPDPTPGDAGASATTTVEPATAPPADAPADAQAPVLSGLAAKGRLRAGRGGRLKATLSEDATLRLVVARLVHGRRADGRCSPRNRSGRRCALAKRRGTVTATRKAGPITLRLPGRIGGRALAAGRYRIKAIATDAAGNRSAPVRVVVRIRRR